ncbi:MAG: hypothetical protein JXN61_04425 [Sedimentisphaerales bacterium]|nr:hypothetical protein [Sedimentisphaerales bacterium]
MAAKQSKVSRRMLFTWFLLAGLILLIAPAKWTSNFQFAFLRVFNWPLRIGENISLSVGTREHLTAGDVVSRREHNQLKNYCANLEAKLAREQQRIETLTRLPNRSFLGNAKLVEALVYTSSIDKTNGELSMDAGGNRDLERGQFVLAENSIIGTISDVSPVGARVKLLTSPASNIAVEMGGVKRFMQGIGGNKAKIPMIKQKPEIGTEVMAARSAGFLNTLIIVGRVAGCERNAESAALWDIIVEPALDIDELRDVVVIVMNPRN